MLLTSKHYHIYNRANGSENLFIEERNYDFFLKRWAYYISPIADTYAWCLMPNHFHFLVKIKEEDLVIKNLQGFAKQKAVQNLEGFLAKEISQQFSNLFNSYTKSFNKVYNRKGSLFIPRFKHKEIKTEDYLKQVLLYIHNNPVHHSFTSNALDWKYSSIHSYLKNSNENTKELIGFFGSTEEYIKEQLHFKSLKQLVEIDDLD
jgi:putative transposase